MPGSGPGRRQTDPADLPSELTAYAMRDLNTLQCKAEADGPHAPGPQRCSSIRCPGRSCGKSTGYAGWCAAGTDAVDDACRRSLDAEVVDVGVIERMLTRGWNTPATQRERR
jgi:hypothetical protein